MSGRIRIFDGPVSADGENLDSSIVYFCERVADIPAKHEEKIGAYLLAHEQTMSKMETPDDLAHLKGDFYEVQPPLAENQIRSIGRTLLACADSDHNNVFVIDNRVSGGGQIPERHLQTAGPVINFV